VSLDILQIAANYQTMSLPAAVKGIQQFRLTGARNEWKSMAVGHAKVI
jgi:hypothetical protein